MMYGWVVGYYHFQVCNHIKIPEYEKENDNQTCLSLL